MDSSEGTATTILGRFGAAGDARRSWKRVPSRLPMRCRRLARVEIDVAVEVVDMSPGGACVRCGGLMTGDLVLCSLDGSGSGSGLDLKGRVVQTRPAPGGPPFVHVAWVEPSPEDRRALIALHDAAEAAAR